MSISHSNVNKISSHIKAKATLCVFAMGMSIKYSHILKLKLNYEYFPTMGNTHSLALALKCEDIY
jgi:hypothetical protein